MSMFFWTSSKKMVHTTRRGLIKRVKFLKKKPVWHNLLFLKSALLNINI